ncbi:penicillin-binding protein 2 [Prochlorococcus sp. MIT 1223]|uniref:peptidoglycan D,D-transpeptidase FtsI family protein n=1 Tax=Prochlorococcus sp. MIT 1223 TaxID=3096217 RepID=UPI002A76372C|nr:penicillin-binding protein 2 [Prochlorococcus sp. MIT 1223]
MHKRKILRAIPLNPVPAIRLKFVFAILCLGLSGLMGRIAWLQILQAPDLEARARSFQTEKKSPLGTRRVLIDRRGRLLALDEEKFTLWAHPKYFHFLGDPSDKRRTPKEVAQRLSGLINVSHEDLISLMEGKSSGVRVKEGLSPEIARLVERLQISGVDLERYLQRVYPQGDAFANVIGFLDRDRIPQAGLEQSLNKQFLRKEKVQTLRRGGDGTPLPDKLEPGIFDDDDRDLQLTIDTRLQMVALRELNNQVEKWDAEKGVAIVMDANNGEILTLASTPSYDPNKYWKYSPKLFREWSVQDLFEPGSVFKPINLAVALEEGVIKPDGTVYDSGVVHVGGWPLKNWNHKANGLIDYAKVLQVSSNVGMVNIMKELDSTSYWEWLHRLGINKTPVTDLPGAIGGQLRGKDIFIEQPIHKAVASFGQGFSITPLKLVQLHALIANGGKLVTPHITKGFVEVEGSENIEKEFVESNQFFSPEVTQTVLSWMESVVERGSGKGVQTESYRIGGKTGTADKSENGKGYTSKICSFVAILPVEKPKYVVLVAVDEPKKPYAYGSTVAVPVAKKIIESLLVLEKIPPSQN